MKLDFESVIIGAGVSGMTAAIYLKRAGINFLILEQNYPGGQLNRANTITNYPGILSIDGPSLVMNIVNQLKELNIDIQYEKVLSIIDKKDYKIVKTTKKEYKTKTILLATGRIPNELGLENEKSFIGRGLSWCASCDGNFYKDENVAVIGGGNTAISDALYLSNIAKKVYIINRSENFRADKTLIEKAKKIDNIEFILNSNVVELIENQDKLSSIKLDTGKELLISGLFEAIGSKPSIDYLKEIDIDTENGYIIVKNDMQTSVEGIYASGDSVYKDLYQIVTATSEGAKAASSIIKYLQN